MSAAEKNNNNPSPNAPAGTPGDPAGKPPGKPSRTSPKNPVPPRPDPVREWLDHIDGAYTPNTERALRHDIGHYRSWCRKHHLRPWPVRAVNLARFVRDIGGDLAFATVKRRVFSIAALCGGLEWKDPRRTLVLKAALNRVRHGQDCRQAQALGLTRPLVNRLLEAAGDRLIDARNRALVAVAYDAMLRRSELVALQRSDLSLEFDGSATVLVRRSKTDPQGGGAVLFLAPDTVRLVLEWLDLAGIDEGFLFRSVHKGGRVGEKLDDSQVPRIFKSMALAAGLGGDEVAAISGHSARVGAAQDMVTRNISMPTIMQAGRWKSTAMVSRYSERILPGRNGSAQLASLQERHLFPGSGPGVFPGSCPEPSAGGGKRRGSRTKGPGNTGRENPEGRETAAGELKTIGRGKSGKSADSGEMPAAKESPAPRSGENLTPGPSPRRRETAGTGAGKRRFQARAAVDGGSGEYYSQAPDSNHYRERSSGPERFNFLFLLGFLFPLPHRPQVPRQKNPAPSGPGNPLPAGAGPATWPVAARAGPGGFGGFAGFAGFAGRTPLHW